MFHFILLELKMYSTGPCSNAFPTSGVLKLKTRHSIIWNTRRSPWPNRHPYKETTTLSHASSLTVSKWLPYLQHTQHSSLFGLHSVLPLKTVFGNFKCESSSEKSLFCIPMPENSFGNMLGKVGQSVLGNEDMKRAMTDVMVMGGLISWSKPKTGW